MQKYSVFNLIKNALNGHKDWEVAWKEPTPKPEAVPEAETYTSGGAGPRNLNEGGLTNSDNSAQQGLE